MDTTTANPFWGTFYGQISIELIGGIIGSFIFLFSVLLLFKPKIRIAPFVCKRGRDGKYLFKFVNVSYFSAHDIAVELHKIKKVHKENGKFNNIYEQIQLVNGHISHIPARRLWFNSKPDDMHCIVVGSVENITEILADDMQGIVIKVRLKHGLTGLAKVFEKEYFSEASIKNGTFVSGTKFGHM